MVNVTLSVNPEIFNFLFKNAIFSIAWLIIIRVLSGGDIDFIDDSNGIIIFIVGIVSSIAAIVIFRSSGVSTTFVFLFIGSIQMVVFPLVAGSTISSQSSSALLLAFIAFEIVAPLFIYSYFNPDLQLICF